MRGSGHARRLENFASAFGAWLGSHGIAAAAPRLPIALAGSAALHRFRSTEGDLLLAVPTAAPGDSFDVSLELGPKQEAVLLFESPWSRLWRLRMLP